MKIKAKLTVGVGALFLLILALAVVSGWYVNQLKKDTNNILVANYNTLQYSRNMLLSLEDLAIDKSALDTFQKNLDLQQKNVTEIGEVEATNLIIKHFKQLMIQPEDSSLISNIRKDITELMRLNMEAINRKSDIADDTAQNAIVIISVTGSLCFLIAFILLVNLPSSIANPITELTDSIKEIAGQNYRKRVHFEGHNEFGDLAKSFNTMAEKLEEYSESKLDKILKGKKRIETLIDNLHDPVIGIDENKKVLFANEEALSICGLKKEEFIGKQIQDIAVTNDLIRNIIKDIFLPKPENTKSEQLKIYADSKESYFEKEVVDINIVPTGEADSEFIGQVILLRNITPFKELDLAKTNFMGTVSHEFKTPISSMQLGIQILQNEKTGYLNEEQKGLISGIKDDVERLLRITGELLNITQVESGAIQINLIASEMRPMVDYAVNANKSAAEHKNINIEISIEDDDLVAADSEKTAWVLTNLISNAVRYSYENSTIHVKTEKIEDIIQFSVTDTGQGIQPQFLSKIFERYFRIPGTKKEGTGLGLSISKEFIEAQGGKIWVESEYGAGSTFYFTLNIFNINQ
ncbi:PAS domain-containing sensor histidine kinase [Elizabethkingia anophelis]|uniref:ATP-binding protein n=2 Tax=Bacteroidota TaxID=976 RepID=A0ACD5C6W9_9SPHI|nr:ATP-binding protein [Elizabethkingia anophelis]OJU76728.1 MAG: PAS domain-containing sensor histidine kinase [Bacteroidetes bacterium 47-18]MDV3875011.1 PAS domain-containing sensor histidine kinase [Elizabethkingia anophelis]MDV3892921.1 PAS domain-containing sensor histidine kinase [Elizabethkingia anophelis]MDV3916482.1 PAS domain-containing sensor histidine kinase [Elizabethkingia anophelis]MDV3919417.1 PAS domain-containing sensor histidine kinase [Elizabethkingia anophelis]